MARQISSHCGVGPQDVHGDLSSNNSNVAAGNSLVPSGLKFGTIIFKDKYIVVMENFTTVGLSSKIFYRGAVGFINSRSPMDLLPCKNLVQ